MSAADSLTRHGIGLEWLRDMVAPGRAALDAENRRRLPSLVRPMPTNILEWAREHVELPAGQGIKSGPFAPLPWQVGWFDIWQEIGVDRHYVLKVPRTGYSQCLAVDAVYLAAHEGHDGIYYDRSAVDAHTWHDSMLAPILDNSPALQHLVRPPHLDKWYDRQLANGAFIRCRSASKDGSFRGIKGKRVRCDEIADKAWLAKGNLSFGDKMDRAAMRCAQYNDGLLIGGSSPGLRGTCLVTKGWDLSDQRKFFISCPACGEDQPMEPIVQPESGAGLCYELDETGRLRSENNAPVVFYRCRKCERPISEREKIGMMGSAYWRATATAKRSGYVGTHIWSAYVDHPKSRWRHIADEHMAALADASKMKTFANEWLGIAYDPETSGPVDVIALRKRRARAYPAPSPDPVAVVTVGFDNQSGAQTEEKRQRTGKIARSEYTAIGWGAGQEAYVIEHGVIPLTPFTPESNAAKIALMNRIYGTSTKGDYVMPGGAFDDIGDDLNAGLIFTSSKEARAVGIQGIRGYNESKGLRTPTINANKGHYGAWEYDQIGTQQALDDIFRSLSLDGFGPGRIHFPLSLTAAYYKSLSAVALRDLQDGRTWWEGKEGNEALDCFVYAYARMLLLMKNNDLVAELLALPLDPDRHLDRAVRPVLEYAGDDRSYQSAALVEMRRIGERADLPARRFRDPIGRKADRIQQPPREQLPALAQRGARAFPHAGGGRTEETGPEPSSGIVGAKPRMGW